MNIITKVGVTWLARGIVAHVTVTIKDPKQVFRVEWLMGPDGEHCLTPHSLLGGSMTISTDGPEYPDRCSLSYDEALSRARTALKDEWM